jgi:hypothetical protein
MGRGRYSTAQVVHRLARAGLLEVVPEPFSAYDTGADNHEPSAAERMAAVEVADTAPAPAADTSEDTTEAGDDAWAAWATGNPFDHPPTEEDEATVSFGPTFTGADGPEAAPDDALLPRRTAVREADPAERPVEAAEEEIAPGLAGITGFHDPTAEVAQRQDQAMAEAADPTLDPNAAWLENLYAQFIDDSAEPAPTRSRKKEALDVAFQAPEQAESEKVGTLKRLAAALRRL